MCVAGISSRENIAVATNSSSEVEVIDALDRVIQKRFHDVIGFGMARMGIERRFSPNTTEEKMVIKDLKHAGYRVTLFLAGRNILQEIPERFRYNRRLLGSSNDHMISGPVTVGHENLKGLPDARAIWEPARDALRQFAKGEKRYAFAANDWSIEARPVKAFDETCVKCHGHANIVVNPDDTITVNWAGEDNGLRIGDTVGAMLYVYKRKK